ncbi:unnamed protein product [Rotaria sp. Silwood2]|nr:unnamed protein product [Rotaria sp. Silwood2]CAF4574872.1 unnamed protein product [Rotaria sp. Silwood2]
MGRSNLPFTKHQHRMNCLAFPCSLENVNNENIDFCSVSTSSSLRNIVRTLDPVEALQNPKTIPPRILAKCKQILLSSSPIITKTCWNRRFGGDSDLCSSAVQLLTAADMLLEGQFATSATKAYTSWIKNLPSVPTDPLLTLDFQQTKLGIFDITWNKYSSSFKHVEFGHSNTSTLTSSQGAEILRSKPYNNIGFVLNESIVLSKNNRSIDVVSGAGNSTASITVPSPTTENLSSIEIQAMSFNSSPIGMKL